MNKITVLALILAVILGECLAAFVFLGRGGSTAAAGAAPEAADQGKAAEKHLESGREEGHAKPSSHGSHVAKNDQTIARTISHGDDKEMDLGEYSIMATDPASSTMLLVDFHIFGTVASSDNAEFNTLYEENRHRIRNQVITIAGAVLKWRISPIPASDLSSGRFSKRRINCSANRSFKRLSSASFLSSSNRDRRDRKYATPAFACESSSLICGRTGEMLLDLAVGCGFRDNPPRLSHSSHPPASCLNLA